MKRTRVSRRNSSKPDKPDTSTSTSCPSSDQSCRCRIKDSYLTYLLCTPHDEGWTLSGNISSLNSSKMSDFPSTSGQDQTFAICFMTCCVCLNSKLLRPANSQPTKTLLGNLHTAVIQQLQSLNKS